MERSLKLANGKDRSTVRITLVNDRLIAAVLFLVALVPRVLALDKFITGDEPRWVVRSASFLTGLLTTDWQSTLQTGHPGVTTMWSGSLGLILDYALNHRAGGTLLTFVQSLPRNELHIDPTVLPWMRLPIAVLTALSIVVVFWLLRSLDKNIAIIAALLLAFHPVFLGNSQLLHHDALVSVFITFAVLLLLMALRSWSWAWIVVSGVMAGLAVLSKSTAYALFPFIFLALLFELMNRRISWRRALLGGMVWGLAASLTVVALWPALWVAPVAVWQTVFGWASDSADVGNLANTLVPNLNGSFPELGFLFYPANWLLKSTPLTILGLLLVWYWWRKEPLGSPGRWWTLQLLLWIGLFMLILTLGDKRDGRYLLPIYFALCILAAFGLFTVYRLLVRVRPLTIKLGSIPLNVYQVVFVIFLLGFSVAYYPYYLAYYNPLIGGPWLAPRMVKVGLGDGMEQAAAWLNAQPDASGLTVATDLEQTFSPFFVGHVTHPHTYDTFSADYVLNYVRQIQNGVPFAEYWDYYEARPPSYKLSVAGIDYLWLHKARPLATLGRIPFGNDLILRAYTLNQELATPGSPLRVTLIWRTSSRLTDTVRLQLRDETGLVWATSDPAPVIDPDGPSKVEGHYALHLPSELPRGDYLLWATVGNHKLWTEITTVAVGRVEPIEAAATPIEANFAHRIALRGVDVSNETPAAGDTMTLIMHWQALQPMIFSFTTFIHVLDSAGEVVAQSDVQPGQGQWLTTGWHKNEWITDQVSLALPPELSAGKYQIVVGWYQVETGQRLPLADNERQDSVIIGTITVPQ
jgi:hypothetical protein